MTSKNLEKLKRENNDLNSIFSWLEEYSTIKINEKDGESKQVLVNTLSTVNTNIPLTVVKKMLAPIEDLYNNSYDTLIGEAKFINFSEDVISKIEHPTFNIFELEKEVGEENTLSTVSCYVFTSMGFYSIINYEKFDGFIDKITQGYKRTNPFHNVTFKLNLGLTCR